MIVLVWLKDALLCLLVCSTLANLKNNKKITITSIGIIIVLFLMGIDL